jgi:acetyl-CoA synthetase
MNPQDEFHRARDLLLAYRHDPAKATEAFRWPEPEQFNWALDHFDVAARAHPERIALWLVDDSGGSEQISYGQMADSSAQLANWLRDLGVARGDPILAMLGNRRELWQLTLAAMKLGALLIPSTTLLTGSDLADRVIRGRVRHVVAEAEVVPVFADVPGTWTRIVVGEADGWRSLADSRQAATTFEPDGRTSARDPLFLYFTSGTTSRPKLVEHSYLSYPVGHLSTMYWIGLRPGDVHLNVSSPGWAKHAWSSVFAPWNAEATIFVYGYARFAAPAALAVLRRYEVTSVCAPPTVWRLLIQADLGDRPTALRELVAAGEPLNPEVIERVRAAWGLTVRDGYGQTETAALIGNPPGVALRPGSMGRPLPGYRISLVDPVSEEVVDLPGREGEICVELQPPPVGLLRGYRDDPQLTAEATRGGRYHTGDVAVREADGTFTFVGRTDDVFKASDYRVSPFELESVLLEHPAVAEAAVVPAPDPLRLAVPKAYLTLAAGWEPDRATALAVFRHSRARLAPYLRVRRLEFAELPKTISGKIRRVELREREVGLHAAGGPRDEEWREEDFTELNE